VGGPCRGGKGRKGVKQNGTQVPGNRGVGLATGVGWDAVCSQGKGQPKWACVWGRAPVLHAVWEPVVTCVHGPGNLGTAGG